MLKLKGFYETKPKWIYYWFFSAFLIAIIKDLLIPVFIRKRQDKLYHKNKLLESVYTPLYKTTSNFDVKDIKPKSNNEFIEYFMKTFQDLTFNQKLYLSICTFSSYIPIIRNLKLITLLFKDIIFDHLEDFVSSYEIVYPKEAYSEIVKIIEPHLAICDDGLVRLYKKLKRDKEETFLYGGAAAILSHLFEKKPEIFKMEEKQREAAFKEELNKLNIKEGIG